MDEARDAAAGETNISLHCKGSTPIGKSSPMRLHFNFNFNSNDDDDDDNNNGARPARRQHCCPQQGQPKETEHDQRPLKERARETDKLV